MQRDVECEPLVLPSEKPWCECKMGRTANGQKLGESLYDCKDHRLVNWHSFSRIRRRIYSMSANNGFSPLGKVPVTEETSAVTTFRPADKVRKVARISPSLRAGTVALRSADTSSSPDGTCQLER